ncbi:MAG: response regulator [Verrucomicrobia bacterium]|nr:response regulator [Verrucomicrobiota bacterium]
MKNKTILLIEDDSDDEELTLRALRQNRIANRVAVARDGAEALDYLLGTGGSAKGRAEEMPAVVILDLKLPRIDGLEVLRRLRANSRTKFLPVVILTSSREEQDILKSYRLGVNSYICKPVDFEKFSAAVGQLGLYWLLLNELPPSA